MAARYDLMTSRKDREGKTRYTRVGTMFPRKEGEGFALKFDALPIPNEQGEVWVSAFVPRENDGQGAPQRQAPSSGRGDIDDDIPF